MGVVSSLPVLTFLAGGASSMGESGGGGMSVPSVSEKWMGARAGSSNFRVGALVCCGITAAGILILLCDRSWSR
jgi:hypothetical protein